MRKLLSQSTFGSFLALCVLLPQSGVQAEMRIRPPFVVDCAPRRDEGEREPPVGGGIRRLPDRRYTPRLGYGYESGDGFRHWYAVVSGIWGRPERGLFHAGRADPESYRFDLPDGKYTVGLGFCEIEEHREGRRIFDILIQSELVRARFDPFAVAGFAQAFRLTVPVAVRGGDPLTIVFRRRPESARAPSVNAVWILEGEATFEGIAPRPPDACRGFGSYGMNVLFWDHPEDASLTGYRVERRAPGEKRFSRLTRGPVPVCRWIDEDLEAGKEYCYRVSSVDLRGRPSAPARTLRLSPRSSRESSLPVYSVEVWDEALREVLGRVTEDWSIDGFFTYRGERFPIRFRLRGASSRRAGKLSYRLSFREASPFPGRDVLYLKAVPGDYTFQQEKLTCDVFALLGLPVSSARYINLFINGRYRGVYLDVERVDRRMMERAGLRGTLFRSSSFQHLGGPPGERRGSQGETRELVEFIRKVNRLERGEFESFVKSATDWPRLRDYLVSSALCHRSEIEAADFFYCHDMEKGWVLVPWDHNNGNFGVFASSLEVREPFIPLFGQTLQGIGPRHRHWYVLASRIFHHQALRREYLDRLEELTRELLLSDRIPRLIHRNYESLREELVVDPYRWIPGRDEPFHRSPADLRRFARQHGRRLLELIKEERRRRPPPVVINEFRLGGTEGWVELHNRSDVSVSLEGLFIGSLRRPDRPWYRFSPRERLEPGSYRLVRVEYPAATYLDPEEVERLEREERERLERRRLRSPESTEREEPEEREAAQGAASWETEERRPPDGTVALFARPATILGRTGGNPEGDREADLEAAERGGLQVLDWYFYGQHPDGFSYGRKEGGFGFLEPSPGSVNE